MYFDNSSSVVVVPEVPFTGVSSSSIWSTISDDGTFPYGVPVEMMSYKNLQETSDSDMERYRDMIHRLCSSQEHCKSLLAHYMNSSFLLACFLQATYQYLSYILQCALNQR